MGTLPFRRLRRRRTLKEIKLLRARWALAFYIWGSLLGLSLATAQTVEVIAALIEGRPSHLVVPLPAVRL